MTEYGSLFMQLNPDFFAQPRIMGMNPAHIYEEMIMDLRGREKLQFSFSVPEGITFGWFNGDYAVLQEAVRKVEEHWAPGYVEGSRAYCAFYNGQPVSFCHVSDMGKAQFFGKEIRVGGPGCVGTVPEFRRKGIGLSMIQNATNILLEEGYDISYIHYTGVAPWYAHLGYESVVRWNHAGIIE